VCLRVMIGVRADGTRNWSRQRVPRVIAVGGGFAADLPSAGDDRSGDGALGFWKALREVFPDAREQRCWFHVGSNVIAALPKSAHPGAKTVFAEIYSAEDRGPHTLTAVKAFEADYSASGPRRSRRSPSTSTCCWCSNDYPAQHWIHLRTTNPIVIHLCHRPASAAGHQGPGLTSSRRGNGVGAHRVRTSPLARRRRSPTSSPWSAPVPGWRMASSSNEPTNQEVISKSHDRPIRKSGLFVVRDHTCSVCVRSVLAGLHPKHGPRDECTGISDETLAGCNAGLDDAAVSGWKAVDVFLRLNGIHR
jgi:hypothetical protein